MNTKLIGPLPALPGWLYRIPGLSETMPSERMNALRLAMGLAVLLDLLLTYLPHADIWRPIITADVYGERFRWPHLRWSLTRIIGFDATLVVGLIGAGGLILARPSRLFAFMAYLAMVSFTNADPMTTNGGDFVRNTLLLTLVVATPLHERNARVASWPLLTILTLMTVMYTMNGINKVVSPGWRDGTVIAGILADGYWSNIPELATSIPDWLLRSSAWMTLVWELTFPLVVVSSRLRPSWFAVGIAFHIGTGLTLMIGMFPVYSLCLYVPFMPWERLTGRWPSSASHQDPA